MDREDKAGGVATKVELGGKTVGDGGEGTQSKGGARGGRRGRQYISGKGTHTHSRRVRVCWVCLSSLEGRVVRETLE